MTVLRFTRYTTDPADAAEMLARRTALVAAARSAFPGLLDTQLAKLDDGTWIDIWHWESLAQAHAAIRDAPSVPEAAAAISLAKDVTVEFAEVVGAE
jgi:hypothetical protein